MASPIVHNWTLLFLSLVQPICFDRKFEICGLCLVPLLFDLFWAI
jgi:hypothetical protein